MSPGKHSFSETFPNSEFISTLFGQYLSTGQQGLTYLGEIGYLVFFLFHSENLDYGTSTAPKPFCNRIEGKRVWSSGIPEHMSGLFSLQFSPSTFLQSL